MSLKILVVESKSEVYRLTKSMIEPLGLEVLALADSREAARRLETEKFDGVMLEVHMPHLDGFELTKLIRATPLNRAVPVVMIAGEGDADTMRRGFKVGVTFYLGKPITREKLYALLRATRGIFLREKRRHTRLPYRTTVHCRVRDMHFRAESINISEGGMLLERSGGARVGEILELEFTVPPGAPLSALAKVIRKDPSDRTSLQFTQIASSDREVIKEYVLGEVRE
jgi:CheY-like chemotaxis protein